jgi:hypothetical protein
MFVDGTGLNFAARSAQRMTQPAEDNIGILHIGQNKEGTHTSSVFLSLLNSHLLHLLGQDQFLGKLQDVFFFSETLSNRYVSNIGIAWM